MKPDRLYQKKHVSLSPFCFDEKVAEVFDDMINRSVPGYQHVQGLSRAVCEWFAEPGTCIYDLGCSSGSTLALLAESEDSKLASCRIIGLDSSDAMIAKATQKLERFKHRENINLECCNLLQTNFSRSSVVLLNYTLQFLPIEVRPALIKTLFEALIPGGVLLLSEKVLSQDQEVEDFISELHSHFKQAKGYTRLEIAQKRESLDNVLKPLSTAGNIDLLRGAGFLEVEIILSTLPFLTLLARKA